MRKPTLAIAAALSCLGVVAQAPAATPLSVRDSFRIGSSGTSFCSAQADSTDKALTDMFDTGYAITCRDAALPVGRMYKLRDAKGAAERLATLRASRADCGAAQQGHLADLGTVQVIECKLKDADVGYRAYLLHKGKALYVGEGLSGYDSAIQLGLRSLVADAPVKGEVSIATTGAGDPASFARVQAGTLDPAKALAEAYRRNNSGSYAEAAEFFAAVSKSDDAPLGRAEALANEALQKSNLGRYAEADLCSPRQPSRSVPTPSSPGGCATIGPFTISTRAMPRLRSRSSTSRSQLPFRKRWRRKRARSTSIPRWPSASIRKPRSASNSGPRATNCSRPKKPKSSTARRCSCAALRCA